MDALSFLERFIASIVDNEITLGFSLTLVGVLFLALIFHHRSHSARATAFSRSAPTSLVTIGVLGTFVGIFYGLLDFDVRDVDASVPRLLDGLKLAFVTSIIGMFASVLLRIYQSYVPSRGPQSGTRPEDIHHVMVEIRDDARAASAKSEAFASRIADLIVGDSDTTLITQLQKLRTSTSDGLSELRTQLKSGFDSLAADFKSFAEQMAENNSKALIEALEQVIRDFNVKITEQFGENFKRLNEAVGQLLVWQDNYKSQVEQMVVQFARCLEGIEQTQASVSRIAAALEPVPQTAESLGTIVTTMAEQTEDLDRRLRAFSEMASQASSAFPEIESRIQQLTTGFSQAVTESSGEMLQAVKDARRGFDAAIIEIKESLPGQVKALDQQMQEELTRAIEAMGSQLASLSNKFVEDYTPLTDRLREVLQIARATHVS